MKMEKYTGTQKFKIEHNSLDMSITVMIDFDFNIKAKYSAYDSMLDFIKSMVMLFTGDRGEDFDYVNQWLLYVADYVIKIDQFHTLDLHKALDSEDGYCRLDGSLGIKLIDFDSVFNSIEFDDYEVTICQ